MRIAAEFRDDADAVLHHGDCLRFLAGLPAGAARLVVTSPPYNIGKRYERRLSLDSYLEGQARVIEQCVRVLADDGSLCWQVGTFVAEDKKEPPRYGIISQLGTFNPFRVAFHEWAGIWRDITHAKNLREVLGYLFGPPGWSPDGSRKTSASIKAEWDARRRSAAVPAE